MAQQGYPDSQPLQVSANVYELMLSHRLGRPLAWYREQPSVLVGVILIIVGVFIDLSLLIPLFIVGLVLFVSHTPIPVANLLTPWGLGLALFFLLTGRRAIAMRWDQVTSVTRYRGRSRKGVSSKPLSCRLRRSDGAELTIHERSFEQGDAVCGFIQQQVARANNFRRC